MRQPCELPRNQSRASAHTVGTSTATGSHASEITQGFCRSSTTTLHTEARWAHAEARASPNIRDRPPRGPRIHLSRPKATELSKPSTIRWSCSSLAALSTGKPVNHRATRLKPKPRRGRRSSSDDDPRMSSRGSTRESRAQPPEHPEEHSHGLATRVAETKNESDGAAGNAEAPPFAGDK